MIQMNFMPGRREVWENEGNLVCNLLGYVKTSFIQSLSFYVFVPYWITDPQNANRRGVDERHCSLCQQRGDAKPTVSLTYCYW